MQVASLRSVGLGVACGVSAVICALVLIIAGARFLSERCADPVPSVTGVTVRPLSPSRRLSLNGAEMHGTLSASDSNALELALGQLSGTNLVVRAVWLAWPEAPIAAKVECSANILVFVARDTRREWRVVEVHWSLPTIRDSFDWAPGHGSSAANAPHGPQSDAPANSRELPREGVGPKQ